MTIEGQRRSQVVDGAGEPLLFTAELGDQTVYIEAFDSSGEPVVDREEYVSVSEAGQDIALQPHCGTSGYLATRVDVAAPQELNDAGQILAGANPYVLVDTDGSITPVSVGLPTENHLHYLTEMGAFAVPTIAPLVVGGDTYPTPTWVTISRNGVIAGHYDVLGLDRQAFVYTGGPAGGAPTRLLGTFVDAQGRFDIAPDGQDFGTSNRHGVNDAGTVVGAAREPGEQVSHAAILSGAQPQYLERPADATSSRATMINNDGLIAGYVDVPAATPVVWGAFGYQEIEPHPDFSSLRLLGDDGTLIADCEGTGCYLAKYPDADAFEPLPREVSVREDDGSETFYRLVFLHDMNAEGVLLVSALPSGETNPTAPRTTLLLTPQ